MNIGAHVPTRGRPGGAVEYALAIGADAFQIFVGNPRAWAPPPVRPDLAAEFRERRREARIEAVFVHASYLVNIASPNPAFLERSVELARRELEAAAALGANGLVVHAGAGGPGERTAAVHRAAASAAAIADDEDEDGPAVLLELTAGGAGTVASTVPQAGELLEAADGHPRLGICLDTCHLFAAGYAMDREEGVAACLGELHAAGLDARLELVHANDARDPRGSRRDRHADPGRGHIGEVGFTALFRHPSLRDRTVLAEVPGKEREHARVVADLRRLAGG
jgi:deoxyribonuclease-4